jgi:hypothetical protein
MGMRKGGVADAGFDVVRAQKALVAWMLENGVAEPPVSQLVGERRQAAIDQEDFKLDDCISMWMGTTHRECHSPEAHAFMVSKGAQRGARRECDRQPCKTIAVDSALWRIREHLDDRVSPMAALACKLDGVAADLKRVDLDGLFEAAFAVVELLSSSRVSKQDQRRVASCGVPSLCSIFPILKLTTKLLDDLRAQAQLELAPEVVPTRRRGRRELRLLNEVRYYLHRGGFEVREIAAMVPDGPLRTKAHKHEAAERVRLALRGAQRYSYDFDW